MTKLIIITTFAAALGLQQPTPTPAHPFPNHEEPGANWFCVPAKDAVDAVNHAHACTCLGMILDPMCQTTQTDEEGNEQTVPATGENSKCKVWCHHDHCLCKTNCDKTSHRHMPDSDGAVGMVGYLAPGVHIPR